MTLDAELQKKLESVEWGFAESKRASGIHSLHPYPARFIPQIPRQLIQLFGADRKRAILDPFCGTGTSLVEAMFAGIPACGIELNPLASLIARVRTTPLPSSILAIAERVVETAASTNHPVPPIPRVGHWFREDIQVRLAQLVRAIESVEDDDIRNALKVAFSRIVVRVSNQESDTRYAAINKSIDGTAVFNLFLRSCAHVDDAVRKEFGLLAGSLPKPMILNKDIREVSTSELPHRFSLVVTSPPYPNAYEYWLYHKYRMYWLGMDPLPVRAKEIGARPHYFGKNPSTAKDFELTMEGVFSLLGAVMAPAALVCFLVGDSVIRGEAINNSALLERAGYPHGFRRVASTVREIAANRKSFNLSHARIRQERLEVFRMEGDGDG